MWSSGPTRCSLFTEDVKSPDEQLREKQSGDESWPDAALQEQTAEAAAISN